MKIGVFGGSFNPVHQQHLRIAKAAMVRQQLDQVWLIPVFEPVHKSGRDLLDYDQRRALLELAIGEDHAFRICDAEKDLGGASYTVRTMRHLQQEYRQHQFFLIIGGDSLADLYTWRKIDELVEMVEFIVVERPGYKKQSPIEQARLRWVDCELSDVSSSQIREELRSEKFSEFELLAPPVFYRILRENLYGAAGSLYAEVLNKLNEYLFELPEGLQAHIEGVAFHAFQLALGAEESPLRALVAGLAHDIFRIAPAENILHWVRQAGYDLDEIEKQTPMLAHGAAAAGLLQFEFPGIDAELLDALRWHTLPEPGLSLLGKILVIADTLEPSRKIARREELRTAQIPLDDKFARVLQLKRESVKE